MSSFFALKGSVHKHYSATKRPVIMKGMKQTTLRTQPKVCKLGQSRVGRSRCPSHLRIVSQAVANGTELSLALKPLDESYESIHGFSSFANWILPGHVMVGRYPYVEPGELKKCRTHEVGEKQLRQILEAEIRTFVSVQSDVCSQNDMPVGGDKGFLPYKPTAELIASALEGPPGKETFEGVRNRFIDRFLPKKKVETGPQVATSDCKFVHHPVKGMKELTPADLDSVMQDLESRLVDGERIYIHCWSGRGRAGIVGSCLLAKLFGLSAEECTERVARAFLTRGDDSAPTPLSEDQINFIHSFVTHQNA